MLYIYPPTSCRSKDHTTRSCAWFKLKVIWWAHIQIWRASLNGRVDEHMAGKCVRASVSVCVCHNRYDPVLGWFFVDSYSSPTASLNDKTSDTTHDNDQRKRQKHCRFVMFRVCARIFVQVRPPMTSLAPLQTVSESTLLIAWASKRTWLKIHPRKFVGLLHAPTDDTLQRCSIKQQKQQSETRTRTGLNRLIAMLLKYRMPQRTVNMLICIWRVGCCFCCCCCCVYFVFIMTGRIEALWYREWTLRSQPYPIAQHATGAEFVEHATKCSRSAFASSVTSL